MQCKITFYNNNNNHIVRKSTPEVILNEISTTISANWFSYTITCNKDVLIEYLCNTRKFFVLITQINNHEFLTQKIGH